MLHDQRTVAVFTAYFAPAFLGGGPIRTLSALVRSAPAGFTPVIVASDTDLGQQEPLPVKRNTWTTHEGVSAYYLSPRKLFSIIKAMRSVRVLQPDIIYLSSFLNWRFSLIPQVLTAAGYYKARGGIAIAPRGELGAGALALKSFKKRLFVAAYRWSGLAKRAVWHASSPREALDIRRTLGDNVNIVIRENETDLPASAVPPPLKPNETINAVFVGRLVRIKGLHMLLEALQHCHAPLILDVYGPEEDLQYAAYCKRLALKVPANVSVTFRGAISNELVRATLPQYDLMIFPTAGENFGHVIAEALSVSCPVMCADVTPWTPRLRRGGGVVVEENTVQGWTTAIEAYSLLTPLERMSARKSAGECFEQWRASSTGDHVFNMLMNAQTTVVPPSERH